MIPLWLWAGVALVCLLVVAEIDCWRINRQRDNFRAIEAEWRARQNTAPFGNAERVYDRETV